MIIFQESKAIPETTAFTESHSTQDSIGFYLMILWARVFPEVIYESLAAL